GNKQEQFLLDPQFQDTTWQDRKSYSMKFRAQWKLFDRQMTNRWEYTVASELTTIQEKVYVKVGGQLGNYRYDEDLDEYVQDSMGDYILVIVPSENYLPTSKLLFNWQWEWRPSRKRKKDKTRSFLKKAVNLFQITNRIKIDEKTRHKNLWDIYLLNISQFQKEGETLRGKFLWFNDINFLHRHPVWNIRVNTRYQKQHINIYLDASKNEQRKVWEQEWTLRYRASSHFKQEAEWKMKSSKRVSPSVSSRNRNISAFGLGTRSIFRIIKGIDNSIEITGFIEKDDRPGRLLQAHYFKLKERLTASILKKGRITASYKWYKVVIDKNPLNLALPYEMAEGKKEGDSMEWDLRMDYFVSNYLT
ncbi:MAG: hypothetical protein KAR38_16590, partial [Calditrichia bacterium]|nr:hypothetical protein [Calditrichia bacterium]